nr:type II secretion system protein GspK [Bradyrhizobium campsiandrae]
MCRGPGSHCRDRSNRGFATVPALVLLSILAALAGVAAAYVSSSAASVGFDNERIHARALILAGVELAAYDLLSSARGERAPRSSISFRLDNASVTITSAAEATRIDLNFAPPAVFANLFQELGSNSEDATAYADRLVGWRSSLKERVPDREMAIYRDAGLSYGPKGSSFSSEDELWSIPGLPAALIEKALQFVTVYSGRRQVDVFGAAPEVIAALPGVEPVQAAAFVARRESLPHVPSAVIDLLGSASGMISIYSDDNFRLNCQVLLDNGWRTSAEVVIQLEDGDEPYRVLSWREIEPNAAPAER